MSNKINLPKFRLEMHDELPSTSTFLLERKNDKNFHGLAICARSQTQGVGRRGRKWHTAPGNLAMSIGIKIATEDQQKLLPWIPLCAGIALYETVRAVLRVEQGKQLTLKWPNDLLYAGKKLSGMLCQVRQQKNDVYIALGIGLNLVEAPSGKGIDAISLQAISLKAPELESFVAKFFLQFTKYFPLLENLDELKKAWETRAKFLDQEILFGDLDQPKTMQRARALGLNENAELRVLPYTGGAEIALQADDVSLRLLLH